MSLPSSEHLPDQIRDLPPARQRHIRRRPASASPEEQQILLDDLVQLTTPHLNFFAMSLVGAAALGLALFLNEVVLLVLAVVIFPFLKPVFNLALIPTLPDTRRAIKSLLSSLFPLLLV